LTLVRIVPVEEPSNESGTTKTSPDSDSNIIDDGEEASVDAPSSDKEFEFDD
jgi:hypothetical protein